MDNKLYKGAKAQIQLKVTPNPLRLRKFVNFCPDKTRTLTHKTKQNEPHKLKEEMLAEMNGK